MIKKRLFGNHNKKGSARTLGRFYCQEEILDKNNEKCEEVAPGSNFLLGHLFEEERQTKKVGRVAY